MRLDNKSKIESASLIQKISLVIFGLFLGMAMLEIGLRIGGFIFLSIQEQRNIISIKQKGAYRILCLGESTTAGGEDSYPSQLEKVLNERNIGLRFSVINKGIPGIDSNAILSQLENNLNRYKPNMVITMMGINDHFCNKLYPYTLKSEAAQYFKNFRIYKLFKIIWLHIIRKTQEPNLYRRNTDDMDRKDTAQTYIELGMTHMYEESEFILAEEAFKKAIKLEPNNYQASIELGVSYLWQNRLNQAEDFFRKALGIKPDSARAYKELGRSLRLQGKLSEAEDSFKKAIEIKPTYYAAYLDLASSYMHQGKFLESENLFKKAMELNPSNDHVIMILSYCFQKEGKDELARQYFERATNLISKNYEPALRYNYNKISEILRQKGIKFVCAQYPMRRIESLIKIFNSPEAIIFVDNENVFKKALKTGKCNDYFTDMFAGDSGHCTRDGNRLLARNIADVIFKEYFNIIKR